MKVYKFGGASINSLDRIISTGKIIGNSAGQKTLIVVSAMGKTTNALEKVVDSFFAGRTEKALQLFEQVKQNHSNLLKYLVALNWQQAEHQLKQFFTEVEWMLHDKPVRNYDYYYDQIVCTGELLSTAMISHYLSEQKLANKWLDVRDIIRTDNNFRDAAIDWESTRLKVEDLVRPAFDDVDVVITQGFIGSTDENESTTLGREGSDYTAAIFANILSAESVTIWKDVEAVMSADPRIHKAAMVIPALSFTEVIEMAYYGAQVIHPKTIKPLQNKNIPLFVKSFLDPSLPGTVISGKSVKNLPPIIVDKPNQVLIQFKSKDFSFVEDKPIRQLHELFADVKIKPNLMQNAAISLLCCFDDRAEKIEELALYASEVFDVEIERNLSLITIRHYDDATINNLSGKGTVVLRQQTVETIQLVMRGG